MKTIEEFYNEALQDEALALELDKAHTENRLAQFLAEHDVDCKAESFLEFLNKKKNASRELSDDELDNVSGGVDWAGDGEVETADAIENENGEIVTYEFMIGQLVLVWGLFKNSVATVVDRTESYACRGLTTGIAYPVYKVEYESGSTEWKKQKYLAHIGGGAAGIW
ncbi:MAG: hypothetical protein ACI4WS_01250 [Oscillospiraceae bacterium]